MVSKHCYEFEIALVVNGKFLNELVKFRIVSDNFVNAEKQLIEFHNGKNNVKLVDRYLVNEYDIFI